MGESAVEQKKIIYFCEEVKWFKPKRFIVASCALYWSCSVPAANSLIVQLVAGTLKDVLAQRTLGYR